MSTETMLLWILGLMTTVISADVVSYIILKDKINEFNLNLVQRVSKIEATLALLGTKTAKILHSPDDHLGIDKLLDKYLDRHYELSNEEWKQLMEATEQLENDKNLPTGARHAAATLNAVCHHKLKLDPRVERWWHEGSL